MNSLQHPSRQIRKHCVRRAARAVVEQIESRVLLSVSISGSVFNDLNGNGVRDAAEPPLKGSTVFIDLNHNGKYDAGSDIASVTNASGQYSFTLAPGTYEVACQLPGSSWRQTLPKGGNAAEYGVALDDLQQVVGLTFADQQFSTSGIVVNTTADSTDPSTSTTVSLRDAISRANAAMGPVGITFSPTVFATAKTITLVKGQLELSDTGGPVSINGPAAGVTVSGNNKFRVLKIDSGVTASLSGMIIDSGDVTPAAPATGNASSYGGGIYNSGTLSLKHVTVSYCSAYGRAGTSLVPVSSPPANQGVGQGGGIYSAGALTLENSSIIGNRAFGAVNEFRTSDNSYGGSGSGGGIYSTGALRIVNCLISSNIAAGGYDIPYPPPSGFGAPMSATGGSAGGGGIFSSGTTTINSTTISNNQASAGEAFVPDTSTGGNASGGGVLCTGALSLSGDTFVADTAVAGAAPVANKGGSSLSYGGTASGGAIFDGAGNVAVNSSNFRDNLAKGGSAGQKIYDGFVGSAFGGAIDGGSVAVSYCNFNNNMAIGGTLGGDDFGETAGSARGGAIYSAGAASLQMSSFTQNQAHGGDALQWGAGGYGNGGGIWAGGALSVVASTFSANSVVGGSSNPGGFGSGSPGGGGLGGAIWSGAGTLTLTNSTIVGNSATGGAGVGGANGGEADGAGIWANGTAKIYDSTVTANATQGGSAATSGDPGAALAAGFFPLVSGAVLDNSIFSGNKANGAFDDIGTLAGNVSASSKYNLIGVGGGLTNGINGNKIGINNPLLSPLGNYGGPTQTLVPLANSPAIEAGSVGLIPVGVTTDQRGLPRTVGGKVDIGAVEIDKGGPFFGTPATFGRIQAENFDFGGQNVAYFNPTNTNLGHQYRPNEGIGIGAIPGASGGGLDVGYTNPGEYLNYTVSVAATGTYTLRFRVAAGTPGCAFHLNVDGVNVTGKLAIPNNGWNNYAIITKTGVHLTAGKHVLRLVIDSKNPTQGNGNYDWFEAIKT